jgi:dolichol-phosphate mannosyltransferase
MITFLMKDFIVIPTYNERENIERLIPLIFKSVPQVWVLVVDDRSPDGTGAKVSELQRLFPQLKLLTRKKKEGLRKAYLHAFDNVLADSEVRTITMMDADLSHDPSYLPEMLSNSKHYGVVTGSRYVHGGSVSGWELRRRLLSRFGNIYCRLITRLPVHDCTSGFNTIQTTLLRKLDFGKITMSGYAFIFELKKILSMQGANFKEVPIHFKNRTKGASKISNGIIREGIIAPWKIIFR